MSGDKESLYQELLPLLDSPKRQGQRIWSYCPAHPDGTKNKRSGAGLQGRSLSLHPVYGLDCFSGRCKFEEIVKALRAKGPKRKAGPTPKQQAGAKGLPDNATLKAAYEYRDPETGKLLAVKGRFEWPDAEMPKGYNKSFRWRLPDGSYAQGLQGQFGGVSGMPLWGGEDVIYAPDDLRVWFTEGETSAEAIRARNELAVCAAWGASQKEMPETVWEPLRGKDVILWPDNDKPGLAYMAEVRKALRGIARTITTVRAPVPPKGDAVDYFQRGGTIEDLLANVVVRPTVDVLADDHFVVRIPTDIGIVAFEFAEMAKGRGALDCELTVSMLAPGAEQEPYSQRINLKSHSARESLQRSLGAQFGKDGINWVTTVSTAYSRAEKAYLESDYSQAMAELPLVTEKRFAVEQLAPMGQSVIFFGNGKSGKSYIAKAVGLAIAMGQDFCGLRTQPGGLLYIDYETSNDQGEGYRFRISRLLKGLGLDPSVMDQPNFPMRYWNGRGIPLWDQVDGLKRAIARHGITAIIIDSAGPACGGEPEKAASAIAFFNAVAQLGVTTFVIAHISGEAIRDGSADRPFGSVYWTYLPRRSWFVKRSEDEDSDAIDVGMFCKDINDGKRPKPLAFRLEFDGSEGPVRISRQDVRNVQAFEGQRSESERIYEFLLGAGASKITEICEATGVESNKVREVLNKERGKRFVIAGGTGRGEVMEWGVLTKSG